MRHSPQSSPYTPDQASIERLLDALAGFGVPQDQAVMIALRWIGDSIPKIAARHGWSNWTLRFYVRRASRAAAMLDTEKNRRMYHALRQALLGAEPFRKTADAVPDPVAVANLCFDLGMPWGQVMRALFKLRELRLARREANMSAYVNAGMRLKPKTWSKILSGETPLPAHLRAPLAEAVGVDIADRHPKAGAMNTNDGNRGNS